jgi:hypothetical protein
MHGGQESDGRHSGGTDLDDYVRYVGQHRMSDVANETHQGRPDQYAPEVADSAAVVLAVISVWVVIVFSSGP